MFLNNKIMKKKVFVVEEHDEALRIWRRNRIKKVDLVHVDSHIDFRVFQAKPFETIFRQAKNLKTLKSDLEYNLAYRKKFSKHANPGNYIYLAMQEDLVGDFYWVIPGGLKEFRFSLPFIKRLIKIFAKQLPCYSPKSLRIEDEMVRAQLLGRNFIICNLKTLPFFTNTVLLDIDTDFLVLTRSSNKVRSRDAERIKPWISPSDLAGRLKERIIRPRLITVAYSVNDGCVPKRFKYLGREIAHCFLPKN